MMLNESQGHKSENLSTTTGLKDASSLCWTKKIITVKGNSISEFFFPWCLLGKKKKIRAEMEGLIYMKWVGTQMKRTSRNSICKWFQEIAQVHPLWACSFSLFMFGRQTNKLDENELWTILGGRAIYWCELLQYVWYTYRNSYYQLDYLWGF